MNLLSVYGERCVINNVLMTVKTSYDCDSSTYNVTNFLLQTEINADYSNICTCTH